MIRITLNAITNHLSSLYTIEKLTIAYSILTSFFVFVLWNRLDAPMQQMLVRTAIIAATLALPYIASMMQNHKMWGLARVAFQLSLLSYWYPDTYEFNKCFLNLDHIFANAEQTIFGFQPALTFSQKYHSLWISEVMNMAYFSYYPMIVGTTIYCFFSKPHNFDRFGLLLLGSFFIYYLIYIVLPVTGPQFYFQAIDIYNAQLTHFPAVGHYFRYHRAMLPLPEELGGIFYHLVEMVQANGERPTAAFPSSHVGISTVLMLWAAQNSKRLAIIMLPFYIPLCFATVYIQAHYLIDVFAGLVAAILLYMALYMVPQNRQNSSKCRLQALQGTV